MKLKHIIILQNKIDLVKEGQAKEQYEQIVKFVQGKFLLLILSKEDYLRNHKERFIFLFKWYSYKTGVSYPKGMILND